MDDGSDGWHGELETSLADLRVMRSMLVQLQRVLEASPDSETAYAHMAHELEHTIDQIIIRLARLHRSMLIAHETEESD